MLAMQHLKQFRDRPKWWTGRL